MSIEPPEESEEYKETEEERRRRDERFIDKFFTERELIVKFDNTSNSHEKNAQAWYEAVEKTISALPIYQHDNVGQPPPNTDTSEADSTNDNKTDTLTPEYETTHPKTTPHAWFFRGQKDSRFAFTSTLYRRLLNASSDKLLIMTPSEHEEAMLNAELSLLTKARKIGIGRGLTALETLTLLQHHGSPTRLIDVTSDWKVALFFACESDDDRDGRLFLMKTDSDRWSEFPKDETTTERRKFPIWKNYRTNFTYSDEWRDKWLSGTWPILLPFSDSRMISQRGFFLVGGVPSLQGASILYTSKCKHCKKKRCECSDSTVHPRSDTKRGTPINSHLTVQELRNITSMAIRFGADIKFFDKVANAKCNDWSAVGYSIRIPREYKRTLRNILRMEDVHTDSIYPPLRETVRLFEHVVDESLKQQLPGLL